MPDLQGIKKMKGKGKRKGPAPDFTRTKVCVHPRGYHDGTTLEALPMFMLRPRSSMLMQDLLTGKGRAENREDQRDKHDNQE
jgi:hypothetical protein